MAALAEVARHAPGVVLVDLDVPGAPDLTRQLRQGQATQRCRLVGLTALPLVPEERRHLDACLLKPVPVELVVEGLGGD